MKNMCTEAGAVDEHPAAGLETIPAEQAARPAERALRYLATLADDGTVHSTADACERCTGH